MGTFRQTSTSSSAGNKETTRHTLNCRVTTRHLSISILNSFPGFEREHQVVNCDGNPLVFVSMKDISGSGIGTSSAIRCTYVVKEVVGIGVL